MAIAQKFRAVIERSDVGAGGAFVTVPFDVEKTFGKKKVKVKALINGVVYRGALVRMGNSGHILGILKEIRTRIGKSFGDEVLILLEEDAEPREIAVPEDLALALKRSPAAKELFDKLSYTRRKEYLKWIGDAKRVETRAGRVAKTVKMLEEGKQER